MPRKGLAPVGKLRPRRRRKCFEVSDIIGERAGTRTQDHLIKSQVLYHLSYALAERSPVLWGAPLGDLGAHSKPENRGQYHALVGIPAAFGPERTVDLVRSH